MSDQKGKASRKRQERFMAEFGYRAVNKMAMQILDRRGADWLTDEQMDDVVSVAIAQWRATQRFNRCNRALAREIFDRSASCAGEK